MITLILSIKTFKQRGKDSGVILQCVMALMGAKANNL